MAPRLFTSTKPPRLFHTRQAYQRHAISPPSRHEAHYGRGGGGVPATRSANCLLSRRLFVVCGTVLLFQAPILRRLNAEKTAFSQCAALSKISIAFFSNALTTLLSGAVFVVLRAAGRRHVSLPDMFLLIVWFSTWNLESKLSFHAVSSKLIR